MVHDSVLDAICDNSDTDYEEDACDDDNEDDGELQSEFKALHLASSASKPHLRVGTSLREAADEAASPIREFEPGENINPKTKKKNKKKRRNNPTARRGKSVMSLEHFVVQTCRRIEEPKYPLFREAVERIGVDAMKALLNQVDVIEKCGGQMTADGLRRRSAGGVLWSLLRDHVGAVLYKEIMKEGNRKHIEQQKARAKERESNGKRIHEDVVELDDERQNCKRRRTSADFDGNPKGRSVSRERLPRASLREEVDNVRAPAAMQNAWIQGLRKHAERGGEKGLNPKPLDGTGPKRPVSERLRMTVSYGDLVEEGEIIATDNPVRGVTDVGGIRVAMEGFTSQIDEEVEEEGELKEEGEIAD